MLKAVREAAAERDGIPQGSDVIAFLGRLRGETQFWPTDKDVASFLRLLPAYQVFRGGRLRMVLEALEQSMRSELSENVTLPTNLTVEHVLPQQWDQHWPLPDSVDPIQGRLDRDLAKHRLGNLTLVTGHLNPKMSNAAWPDKQDDLRQFSVMRISSDIRAASTWDETSIAERNERLVNVALSTWLGPPADLQETESPEGAEQAIEVLVSVVAGPPDPVAPGSLAGVLAAADEIGIGNELRRLMRRSREIGLVPRADHQNVAFDAPGRKWLFSVSPQWEDGGSFQVWKSPQAFAKSVPGLSLETAQGVLGASEGAGTLLRQDIDALLGAVERLVPGNWATPTFDVWREQLSQDELAALEHVPGDVLGFIAGRAGSNPIIALRFAAAAVQLDGVFLRAQKSINVPWYFQVRHQRFRQVVAYVNTNPGQLNVDYRLPSSHDRYGMAVTRKDFYAIRLTVRGDAELPVAVHLLRDALDRPA